jgi:hypothetical protein
LQIANDTPAGLAQYLVEPKKKWNKTMIKKNASALQIANDTPAGLAAYLYSKDLARAWRMV